MWQRFTERARRVVFFAQEEAGQLGENHVSPEHLLLGLIRENDSVAARILDRIGVSLGRIRSEVERQIPRGDARLGQDMQLTPRAKRVVDIAYDEARQLSNNYIGTEHLLLGLIREGTGLSSRVLNELGVDLERTRNEVRQVQDAPKAEDAQSSRWEAQSEAHAGASEKTGPGEEQAEPYNPFKKWTRFSERARRAVFFAQEEAGKLGENYVSTEHILLGMTRQNDSTAAAVIDRLGVSLERVRSEIERQVARGDGRLGQDTQLTPRAKRVIDLAYDEARQLNNNYIGTEHLLLGLIREGEGLAGRVLAKLGLELLKTRHEVVQVQGGAKAEKVQSQTVAIPTPTEIGERLKAIAAMYLGENPSKPPLERRSIILIEALERLVWGDVSREVPRHDYYRDPHIGDLGVAKSATGRNTAEVATDARAYLQLAAIFLAKDAHGYNAMANGDQTMFLLPAGTPVKLLSPPTDPDGVAAKDKGGYYVRVLSGLYEGYAGWLPPYYYERTGPDDAAFPPQSDEEPKESNE